MNLIRKYRKSSIFLVVVLSILLLVVITYGKYIYNIIDDYILQTKRFYFNSSVLSMNGKFHSVNNWDGVNPYTLTIDLNNMKDAERYTTADIKYETEVVCSGKVVCNINKSGGTIYQNAHTDSYQITVVPTGNFYENDSVTVVTKARSTAPYGQTLTGTYKIGIKKSKFSYTIEDRPGDKFAVLNLTNSVGYYVAQEAFSTYAQGDQIPPDEYNGLTPAQKAKCYSAIVTLTFDPRDLELDVTNNTYNFRENTPYEEEVISGYKYVKKYSFKLGSTTSEKINFYKKDLDKNYTYPIVNPISKIQVDVVLAE